MTDHECNNMDSTVCNMVLTAWLIISYCQLLHSFEMSASLLALYVRNAVNVDKSSIVQALIAFSRHMETLSLVRAGKKKSYEFVLSAFCNHGFTGD